MTSGTNTGGFGLEVIQKEMSPDYLQKTHKLQSHPDLSASDVLSAMRQKSILRVLETDLALCQ